MGHLHSDERSRLMIFKKRTANKANLRVNLLVKKTTDSNNGSNLSISVSLESSEKFTCKVIFGFLY